MFMAFCIGLLNFIQIGQRTADLLRHIDVSRWRPAAMLYFVWVILDHVRSAIVGPSLVYKFGADVITHASFVTIGLGILGSWGGISHFH